MVIGMVASQTERARVKAVVDSLETMVKEKDWAESLLRAAGSQKDGGSGSLVSRAAAVLMALCAGRQSCESSAQPRFRKEMNVRHWSWARWSSKMKRTKGEPIGHRLDLEMVPWKAPLRYQKPEPPMARTRGNKAGEGARLRSLAATPPIA